MPLLDPSVEYRQIPGYPGYAVGADGTVVSYWKAKHCGQLIATEPQRLLKQKTVRPTRRHPNLLPYKCVGLCRDLRIRHARVHALVLEAFVGPCPEGMQARHLDGNVSNNTLGNLCWGTPLENHADRIRHGTSMKGDAHPKAKLTSEQVTEIRRVRSQPNNKITLKALAERFHVSLSCVASACYGDNWKDVPMAGT